MHQKTKKVLATDLDGTLIPLPNRDDNRQDLNRLKKLIADTQTTLIYVTGRSFESASDAMNLYQLPCPAWMICDVGTSIYQRNDLNEFHPLIDYAENLAEMIGGNSIQSLRGHVEKFSEIQLQEDEHQSRFKMSFYTEARTIMSAREKVRDCLNGTLPVQLIASVNPMTDTGLLDVLPESVDKGSALKWLMRHLSATETNVVFAGDSGNDQAAFNSGVRTILVSNANASDRKQILDSVVATGCENDLYLATQAATSGVLEGCFHWGLFASE